MRGFDKVPEFALHPLSARQGEVRLLPHALVRRWPDRPALQLAAPLAMAAGSVQQVFQGKDLSPRAVKARRVTGLLGPDLYLMQVLGLPAQTAADMLA